MTRQRQRTAVPGPTIPYDADDEAALLGAALLTREAAELVATHTTGADFHVPLHRRIRDAIAAIVLSGGPVDIATVGNDLSRLNGVADVGDAKRQLLRLQTGCPASANAAAYLRNVRGWTRRRRALGLADQLRTNSLHDVPIEGVLAQIEGLAAEERVDTTTWHEVSLLGVLEGEPEDDQPTMLVRDDGACLVYPGRVHVFAGEPESGKSWLALHLCAEQMGIGRHVVYVDFEDTLAGVVARLVALDVEPQRILSLFHYVRPSEPLGPEGRHALAELLNRTSPALVVLDGLTEALTLHGLELQSNRDIAHFLELVPRFVARQGPAVVIIDHVSKDKEQRGRWAIGAQHKLAGVDGVSYGLEVVRPVVRDGAGLVRLIVAKDRPGHVRRVAFESKTAAEITTRSEKNLLTLTIVTPGGGLGVDWRPTSLMERVSRWLELNPTSSGRLVEGSVTGKVTSVRAALKYLVSDGYVAAEDGPRRTINYRAIRPYRETPDE